ncbi:GerMN domain-containing protein [Halalkalibacterium ligniniphilum]|uniref:GerMN domain-containing protein n=1 Tax=Halalkalibacterium ligniniphilum TaxID=1134413 RepID=UPI00034CF078|nr:GerMN domain-containing protein [Halalkalibacterium ligniniphilum]
MKHIFRLSLLAAFVVLGACGQGDQSVDSSEPADAIDTEQNEELPEETTEDTVEAEESTEPEESTEAQSSTEATEEAIVTPVELFFADADVMAMYREERSVEATEDKLYQAALEAWVQGPENGALVSLLPEGVEVQSVEGIDGVAHVSFSSELLNAQVGSGTEEMLIQQIALVMAQFGFHSTQILIDGEPVAELFGHIDTSVPIEANDPESYEKIE